MFILENIASIRKKAIGLLSTLSPEALNTIPEGFNNNIIWNFGHLVVSGYSLVFRVTGVDKDYPIPLVEKYRKGSKPESIADAGELETLIRLSDQFIPTLEAALAETGKFDQLTPYTTGTFGVPITRIADMLITVAMHDTSHWQVIRDYQRILAPQFSQEPVAQ